MGASEAQRSHDLGITENYIHAHGVALQAIGIAGADLVAQYPEDWKKRMAAFNKIDWHRSNTAIWEGRAMLQGRINKAQRQVALTANYLKITLDLPLQPDEQSLEETYMTNIGEKL